MMKVFRELLYYEERKSDIYMTLREDVSTGECGGFRISGKTLARRNLWWIRIDCGSGIPIKTLMTWKLSISYTVDLKTIAVLNLVT